MTRMSFASIIVRDRASSNGTKKCRLDEVRTCEKKSMTMTKVKKNGEIKLEPRDIPLASLFVVQRFGMKKINPTKKVSQSGCLF